MDSDATPIRIYDRRSEPHFWAFNRVFDSSLGCHEIVVYLNLCRRAGQNGTSWPTVQRIAHDCGISATSVKSALRSLKDMQWITVTSGKANGNSSAYSLLPLPRDPAEGWATGDQGWATGDQGVDNGRLPGGQPATTEVQLSKYDTERTTQHPLLSPDGDGRVEWSQAKWGTPEALAWMYNQRTPNHIPAVQTLSTQRRRLARKRLAEFPAESWWEEVFAAYHRSRFLSGRVPPSPGHGRFRPDLDWLLSNANHGASVENCVKVHDGAFDDDGPPR